MSVEPAERGRKAVRQAGQLVAENSEPSERVWEGGKAGQPIQPGVEFRQTGRKLRQVGQLIVADVYPLEREPRRQARG
jgi:hypothetical protein